MPSSNLSPRLPPAPLLLFAVWTILYHVYFLLRLPIQSCFPFFSIISVGYFVAALRSFQLLRRPRHPKWANAYALTTLSVLLSGIVLILSRPDPDDFDFLHRAVAQLGDLRAAFSRTDTAHNVSGLPPISSAHLLTSLEPLLTLAAHNLGFDPVAFAQNFPAALGAALFPTIYFSLFRELRLSRGLSLAATVATVVFLFLDRGQHRSFGNFSLLRLWQGKVLLVSVLLPYILLIQLRSGRRSSRETVLHLLLAGICAVGLSGSALFLVPLQAASVFVALVLARPTHARLYPSRAFVLLSAVVYPLALVAVILLCIHSSSSDVSVWIDGWPQGWFQNAQLVLGDTPDVCRDVLLLLVLPIAALRREQARLVLAISFAVVLLILNPLTGPLWTRVLLPGAFWRCAYLLPLPLCAGLVPVALQRSRFGVLAGSLAIAAALLSALHAPTMQYSGPSLFLKGPFDYRFPPQITASVENLRPLLKGRQVLAPEEVVLVLGLLEPSIRFETARPSVTRHLFRNAGRTDEGERRVRAQAVVSSCSPVADSPQLMHAALADGVNAIIARRCDPALGPVRALGVVNGTNGWRRAYDDGLFVAYLLP